MTVGEAMVVFKRMMNKRSLTKEEKHFLKDVTLIYDFLNPDTDFDNAVKAVALSVFIYASYNELGIKAKNHDELGI